MLIFLNFSGPCHTISGYWLQKLYFFEIMSSLIDTLLMGRRRRSWRRGRLSRSCWRAVGRNGQAFGSQFCSGRASSVLKRGGGWSGPLLLFHRCFLWGWGRRREWCPISTGFSTDGFVVLLFPLHSSTFEIVMWTLKWAGVFREQQAHLAVTTFAEGRV
jgi:hypothetical protein